MSDIGFVLILVIFAQINSEILSSPKLILISFDGFRADYVNATLTPNLYKLSQNGVVAKHMRSVFATKTAPNHMSISTGFYEETHGIVGNEMFDPLLNSTFDIDDTVSQMWDNGLSLPIWIANELQNDGIIRRSGAVMWPGSESTYSNLLPHYLQKYNNSLEWKQRIDIVMDWMTDPKEPANFVAMYFNEPDKAAHIHGPFSKEVYFQISRIDEIIEYLLLKLDAHRLSNDVNLVIVSDHGMAEIKRENIIELNNFIDPDLYKLHGTSPVLNILPKLGTENLVYNTLKNASLENHFTVYRRDEVPSEYHYRNHRRILSFVLVADEGYEIVNKTPKSWNVSVEVWGNHGYNNSLESMRPLFIAKGPAFKTNYTHNVEFDNIDLFPMMCYVLQIFPMKHTNGTLDKVYSMLVPLAVQRHTYSAEKLFTGNIYFVVNICHLYFTIAAVFVIALGFFVTVCGGIILIVCLNVGKNNDDIIYLSSDTESKEIESRIRREKKVSFKEAPIEETVLLLQSDGEEV
ncbi:ectonucleotide pyrophosphatase/phosphodiesterase family member 5-like protein [Leptotrombidium deliense]|uniref:Ectonucleotide pyrophosphatase/phosphodiesterase family member 5-like protein n=1 Tax=Leptotrombidium deliense TaxID=299467 RepID=A0A443SUT6_9ACAR|nr:ectonucleotide pyrophosphatase/phosphodiesterase family member 5-like protein [Leptotrombidium deliense]